MGLEVPFVILHGDRFIRSFPLTGRLTVGASPECQLCFEDPNVDERWGAIFLREGRVYAQREGGQAQKLEPGDAVHVGPFTLARSGRNTEIERITQSAAPGSRLGFTKDPFNLVVLLGGAEPRKLASSTNLARPSPADLKRPSGLTHSTWGEGRAGFRRQGSGAEGNRFDAAPNMSAGADRVLKTACHNLERMTAAPGDAERVGAELVQDLSRLTFAEIVAVLRAMATGQRDNYLEAFYQRVLATSPILSFRWAAVIAERYAASARGIGGEASLPNLSIGLERLVTREATEAFRRAREAGGKLVAGGPW